MSTALPTLRTSNQILQTWSTCVKTALINNWDDLEQWNIHWNNGNLSIKLTYVPWRIKCIQYAYSAFNTSSDASLILYFAVSHLQKIRCRFETMTWYEKKLLVLNGVGIFQKKKKKSVAKTSADIVPFIKAFKPNKAYECQHLNYCRPYDTSWWTDLFFLSLQ